MTAIVRRLSAGGLAVALLVTGCGGDDGGGSATNIGEPGATTSMLLF